MLPSKKRLSRTEFTTLSSGRLTSVFNPAGTLKYKDARENKAAVIISSKNEKRAVYRNKLRRGIYMLFSQYFKESKDPKEYVLYVSKQATKLPFSELKPLLYDLFKKTAR